MAQLVLPLAGAAIGYATGIPGAAKWGWNIGSLVGALFFPAEGQDQQGPRLTDLRVQTSSYGGMIPIVYGTTRVAGNVIWSTDLVEHSHTEEAGGKGGGGSQTYTTYSYSVSCAVALCEGEITGVRKIWADGKLIFDISTSNTGVTGAHGNLRIYPGSETQEADSLMQSHLGADSTPAHRGMAYVVFEDFQLADYGNRVPNFSFEVVRAGTFTLPAETSYQTGTIDNGEYCQDPETGYLWARAGTRTIKVFDPYTQALVQTISLSAHGNAPAKGIAYCPLTRTMWVASGTAGNQDHEGWVLDASTGAEIRSLEFSTGTSSQVYWTWNPVAQRMVLWSVNGNSTEVDPVTYATTSGISSGVDNLVYAYDLPERLERSVLHNDTLAGLCVIDWRTRSVPYTNTGFTNLVASDYDPVRECLWIVDGTLKKLYRLDLDDYTLTDCRTFANGLGAICYNAATGTLFLSEYPAGDLLEIDPADYTTLRTIDDRGGVQGGIDAGRVLMALSSDLLFAVGASVDSAFTVKPVQERLGLVDYTVGEIVSDLCQRVGLAPSDIDVSDLTETVDGYVLARQSTARAGIEALQAVYWFDGVESDNVLKFVLRGGAPVAALTSDDLLEGEGQLRLVNQLETELPQEVALTYISRALDYQPAVQRAQRLTGFSEHKVALELGVTLSDDRARQAVDANLFGLWTGRLSGSLKVSRQWARLEPTDVITVTQDGHTHTLRITGKNEDGCAITLDVVAEASALYTQAAEGVVPDYSAPGVAVGGNTRLELLDIPLLRDQDDTPGFYVAACGYRDGWSGANLFRSSDGGASWSALVNLPDAAVIGGAVTTLGDFSGGNVFDELNTVTVLLQNGTLSSATEEAVLNGANVAVLGDEVIQFKTATLTATDTYVLSGLLRGRFGTEWAIAGHGGGERFILANPAAWRQVTHGASEIDLARSYKAPTYVQTLAEANARSFTDTGVRLMPYAPVEAAGGLASGGDCTIQWKRRARLAGGWRDYADVPLGEESESYEVDILSVGGAVLRTLTSTSQSVTYTAAQQATDFPHATWTQVGSTANFGAGINWVSGLAEMGGKIYAGLGANAGEADVWEYNGSTWTQVGGDGINSSWAASTYEEVLDLLAYNGKLYAGLGTGSGDAEVWEWSGSGSWTKIGGDGINSGWGAGYEFAFRLVVFDGKVIVGIGGSTTEAEVWEWNGSTAWTKIGGDSVNGSWAGTNETLVYSFAVHGGDLYAGLGSGGTGLADVWKYSGGAWTQIGGDTLNGSWGSTYDKVTSLCSLDGTLYAALGGSTGEAEVWAWNGSAWTKVGGDGLGWADSTYEDAFRLVAVNGVLYAGLGSGSGDAEVWRYNGATSWTKIGGDSVNGSWDSTNATIFNLFGDSSNQLWAGVGTTAGSLWKVSDPSDPVPNPINFNVYQLSATVGRGYAAAGQIRRK